jgi:uncharacterized membrane protein YqjE
MNRQGTLEDRSSIAELVCRIGSEATGLLRDSLRLLSAEARERLTELVPALVLLAAAAGTLLVSLMAAGAAIVAALVTVLPLWGAALVVAALALALAAAFGALASRRLRELARPPVHTLDALEEGMEWLRLRSHTPSSHTPTAR